MKSIINPKCPYCHSEYKPKGAFNNRLSGLYGEYCSDTVSIVCDVCGETYYVSKQTRFLARKKK